MTTVALVLLRITQGAGAHPPPPQANDIFGTVNGCASALIEMDDNQDGMIKKGEYLDFVNLLADFLCVPPRPIMDLEIQTVFFSIACLCQEREGFGLECCFGDDAAIFTKGADNGFARTEDEDSYLRAACLLTQAILGPQQCTYAPRTISPAAVAMQISKLNNRSTEEEGLSEAEIIGIIVGAILLALLCCLLLCCAFKKKKEEEEEEEEIVKEETMELAANVVPIDEEANLPAPPSESSYEEEAMAVPPPSPPPTPPPPTPTPSPPPTPPPPTPTPSPPPSPSPPPTPEPPAPAPAPAPVILPPIVLLKPGRAPAPEPMPIPSRGPGTPGWNASAAPPVLGALVVQPAAKAEDSDEDSDNIGKKSGATNDDDSEDEHNRKFAGEGMLPNPGFPEGIVLRHVEVEKEGPGEYEYPERELIEAQKLKREDSVQKFEPYVPDSGVNIPERPTKAPVTYNPSWVKSQKVEKEPFDPRKMRQQLGLGDGEVWGALKAQEGQREKSKLKSRLTCLIMKGLVGLPLIACLVVHPSS